METQLTEQTLQTVEDCGAAEMPIDETLEIAELNAEDWPQVEKRYKIGQLKTKLAVRQAIIKGARSGNPALLKAYQEFAEKPDDQKIRAFSTAEAPEGTKTGKNEGEFDDI